MKRGKALAARGAGSLPGQVVRKFLEDGGPKQATVIAWNGLLAMFPIALVAATLLGLIIHFAGGNSDKVYNSLFAFLPREAQPSDLKTLQQQAGLLGVLALVGLVWSGSALFGAMEEAFALVYHTRPRPFLKQKLMAVGMILLFTVLGGIAVLTSSLLPAMQNIAVFPEALKHGPLALILQFLVGLLAGSLLFLAIFFIVPNRRQRFGQVWPGALLAGVLFELITLLFPTYLAINHGFNRYGAGFALLFLLMSFMYFLGLITFLGVELNSVLYPVSVAQPHPTRAATEGGGATAKVSRPSGRATAEP